MNGKNGKTAGRLTAVALAAMLGVSLGMVRPVQAAETDWRAGNTLVAHALGEANGKTETNTKEAFLSSWSEGFRVMEADFTYTSDGVLAVRHDFEAGGSYYRLEIEPDGPLVMDSQTYREKKAVYELTPITAVELLGLMAEYKDVYLITDTKETDEATVKRQFQDLKDIANNIGAPEVLDRIVPQIYSKEMLGWVQKIHPFRQWIFTLYQMYNPDYADIALFCKQNGVDTVTIEHSRITKQVVDTFHNQQVKVYTHTVNRYKQAESLLDMGVDGIYTDTIKPYELDWIGRTPPRSTEKKTVTAGEKSITFTTRDIMGETHVPLREMTKVGNGFSAEYNRESKVLSLTPWRLFHSIGNEIGINTSGRMITTKADFRLVYGGTDTGLTCYMVDGEVYVPLDKMMSIMLG